MSGFNFGAGGGIGAGFNFGGGAPATSTPATQAGFVGFGFGNTAPGTVSSSQSAPGFNFGAPSSGASTTATSLPVVSSGSNAGVAQTAMAAPNTAPAFNFGGSTAAALSKPASTGFGTFKLGGGLAKPTTAAIVPSGGSSAGLNLTTTQATPTLSGLLGAAPTASAAPVISNPPTVAPAGITPSAGFNFGGAPKLAAAATPATVPTNATLASALGGGIGGGLTTGLTGGLKLGATATATSTAGVTPAASVGFNLSNLTSGSAGTISGAVTTAAASTGFGLGDGIVTSTQASLSTATTTTSSGARAPTMTYHQLEEQINKWMLELDDQEKNFLQKATQVNAWDRLLIDNGEKITGLNTDVERMKIDQQRLDHELDFILAQQRELEEMLIPLEKSVEQLPPINYQQHADLEREHTYQLAENVDAQLKRMCQDLKEIIEHLNTNNSATDNSDPIYQIGKILNVHIDSIQWIDQNTAHLQRRVEDVSKQAEVRRKEQERNFRLAYN